MAFSAPHGIRPMVETVPLDQADEEIHLLSRGPAGARQVSW
ncbi:D-arabinose 1-dehydrogenase-like Zn-dependent alcohol dehydrogenase [Kitasatospora sp. GP82]|nr:D-arabinose 1-dehydrogenase-like Zn-dependent alcohol dehydrogenase [Kitasatospora sp. GP82]